MWIPKAIFELFQISKDRVDLQRQDIEVLRAERDAFRDDLSRQIILSDWLRLQVNQLQAERSALLEKAYGIRVPTPQISAVTNPPGPTMDDFSFDDVGDAVAKKLGFPIYTPPFASN